MATHSNHSAARASLTLEDNFNAEGAQGGLSAAQSARECTRSAGPIKAAYGSLLPLQLVGGLQEVGGSSGPSSAALHDIARAAGDGVSVDDIFDDYGDWPDRQAQWSRRARAPVRK